MNDKEYLSIKNLTKYFGGVAAISNCSIGIKKNLIYGLIGPNGSGKTTLFNLITGIHTPNSGSILFKGERIDGLRPYQISQMKIGRTFQITRVFPRLTAIENLLAVAPDGGIDENRERAIELLKFVNLYELRDEYGGNLSYGQQKLLEFARILMLNPDLILLDEPAAGVNRTLLKSLIDHISELKKMGKTFLIVEHDMNVVMNLCDWIIVLDHGEKIAEDFPENIQKNEMVLEAYFGR